MVTVAKRPLRCRYTFKNMADDDGDFVPADDSDGDSGTDSDFRAPEDGGEESEDSFDSDDEPEEKEGEEGGGGPGGCRSATCSCLVAV